MKRLVDLPRTGGCKEATAAKKIVLAASMAIVLFASRQGLASPMNLAQEPLFVSQGAPGNIFFLNDDSGSMDWHTVTSETDGVMELTAGGNTTIYKYLFPDADNNYGPTSTHGRVLPDQDEILAATNMPADGHGVWRGRFHGYNKIYYNPEVTYRPWAGVDSAGAGFVDATPTAVRLDAFDAASATVDLTADVTYTSDNVPLTNGTLVDLAMTLYRPTYYAWTDSDSDGIVDATDGYTRYEIRTSGSCSSASPAATCPATFTHTSARTDCLTGPNTCSAAEELQNFANWYQFYRRRELASKNAIGSVVAPLGSEVRVGHATLHNNSGSSNIQIAAMNADVTSGNKLALMNAVYLTQSNSDTPLRTKLYETGRYYQCASGSIFGDTYTCPWLAAPQGTCQQSFTIGMTDGFYNDSFSSLPGSGSNAGHVDRDGNSPNSAGNTSFDGGAYADDYAYTLADVAMHFYERDLSGLANNVPVVPGVDNASHQHMVFYGVAFGVNGTLPTSPPDPNDITQWKHPVTNAQLSWPDPFSGTNNPEKIDDLRHAAYNGRGKFLSASDPVTLADSIQDAIKSITGTTGSASAVAVNSRTLTTGTTLFQARFKSLDWSGELRAISLDATTGDIGAEVWNAGEVMKTQSTRSIITYRKKGTMTGCPAPGSDPEGGRPFAWSSANLSNLQRCLLDDDPTTPAIDNDALGDERLDYLRGVATNENTGLFRDRVDDFKLGDIVNSTPVFVGAPEPLPEALESPAHSTFRTTHNGRKQMLYVGANDGMLHGLDADTGQERIGYVPAQVYPNLGKLTDPTYRNLHQYYVDGSPTVADAFGTFDAAFAGKNTGCPAGGCWRSVLAGGLAGGGKGIFALDVTDPTGASISSISFSEANAANIALWEFVDSTEFTPGNDMGFVYGEVAIAKMHAPSGTSRWVAIFGNGYNSVNENAVLYIVDIATGSTIKKLILNPYESVDGSGNPINLTGNSNGLSAPLAFDRDGDSIVDFIYAGDLRGNLWKIDVTDNNPTNWDSAHKNGNLELPLFIAVDGTTVTTVAQPITARPTARLHPDGQTGSSGQPTYMVYVGTGRYLATGDKNPTAPSTSPSGPIQTMYGIWDKNSNSSTTPVARSNLLAQSITQTTLASQTVRVVSNNVIDWTTHKGWRLDLRTNFADSLGEMSVTNPVLATSAPERLIFTTLIPTVSACEYGGTSWLMEVSPKNGGNLGVPVFDVNEDGVVDAADMVGTSAVSGINPGIGILPEPVIVNKPGTTPLDLKLVSGSTGAIKSIKNYLTAPSASSQRRSWRQLK